MAGIVGIVGIVGPAINSEITMIIKNRTDIEVPEKYRREFEVPEDLQDQELVDAISAVAGRKWQYLDLEQRMLNRANLAGLNLARAMLSGASFCDTDLTGADLTETNLRRAMLSGANLAWTDLTGANLSGIWMPCARHLALAKHPRILPIDWPNEFGWEIAAFASHRLGSEMLAVGPPTVYLESAETRTEEFMNWKLPGAYYFWRDSKKHLLRLAKEKIAKFRSKGTLANGN